MRDRSDDQEALSLGTRVGSSGRSPLKLMDIWTIRLPLELVGRVRDLMRFNLARHR
jgi:hypothetical protein